MADVVDPVAGAGAAPPQQGGNGAPVAVAAAADGQNINNNNNGNDTQKLLAAMQAESYRTQQMLLDSMALTQRQQVEQLQREQKQQTQAAQEKAAAAKKEALEEGAKDVRALKNYNNKLSAGWILQVSGVDDANDRGTLARALVEAVGMMESDKSDIEEPNALIEAAVGKLTSLSKEKQADLLKGLKIKKRPAAGMSKAEEDDVCSRCHRVGHQFNACHAQTTVSGLPLDSASLHPNAPVIKRRGQTGGSASFSGGYGGNQGGYGIVPPPFQAPPNGGFGQGFNPYPPPPPGLGNPFAYGPSSVPYGGSGYQPARGQGIVCHNCSGVGHISRMCPRKKK